MNRHERRRQQAYARGLHAGKTGELDPEYVAIIGAISAAFKESLAIYPAGYEKPRFRFVSPEVMVIGALEPMIPRIALNEGAAVFMETMAESVRRSRNGEEGLTVSMMHWALKHAGADIEYVSPGEFGITVGGVNN